MRRLLAALPFVVAFSAGGARPHEFSLAYSFTSDEPISVVWHDGAPPLKLRGFYEPRGRVWSPDRTRVAIGAWADKPQLPIVDLVHRRLIRSAQLASAPAGGCSVQPLVWSARERLVAHVWCGGAHDSEAAAVATVDGTSGHVVARRSVGVVFARVQTREWAVLLASPPLGRRYARTYARVERTGPARLIVVGRDGSVRVRVLRIRAGYSHSRMFNREPGLAVRGDRAIVVAEGDGAAMIDLRTLRVGYHRIAFPARPRRLALRPRRHEGTSNPSRDLVRTATWLDANHVAVTGIDSWTRKFMDQQLGAGLRILDTRTWRAPLVDSTAAILHRAQGFLIVTGVSRDGIRVYDVRGRLRLRRFAGWDATVTRIRARRVIVVLSRRRGERPRHATVLLP